MLQVWPGKVILSHAIGGVFTRYRNRESDWYAEIRRGKVMLAGCEAAKLCFQRAAKIGIRSGSKHGNVWEGSRSSPKTGISAAKLCC